MNVVASTLSRVLKPAVLITLAIGMYLHLTRLFIGTELLIEHIYTPTLDVIFAIPMTLGAIAIPATWEQILFRNRFEKGIAGFTGAYFLFSVPLHVQTWYTWSTDYILVFPVWFSAVFLAYASLLTLVWWRLKILNQESPAN